MRHISPTLPLFSVFPPSLLHAVRNKNAFRALNGDMGAAGGRAPHEGVGILVSEESRETNAAYTLRNPDEVASFLEKIAEFGSERCRSRFSGGDGGGGDSVR